MERIRRMDDEPDFATARSGRPPREAAAIGGSNPDVGGADRASRSTPRCGPVYEAGGGEEEGFELAERDLVRNASHDDGEGFPERDAFTPERSPTARRPSTARPTRRSRRTSVSRRRDRCAARDLPWRHGRPHRLRPQQGHGRQPAAARRVVQARAPGAADDRRAQRRRQDDAAADARGGDVGRRRRPVLPEGLQGRAARPAPAARPRPDAARLRARRLRGARRARGRPHAPGAGDGRRRRGGVRRILARGGAPGARRRLDAGATARRRWCAAWASTTKPTSTAR